MVVMSFGSSLQQGALRAGGSAGIHGVIKMLADGLRAAVVRFEETGAAAATGAVVADVTNLWSSVWQERVRFDAFLCRKRPDLGQVRTSSARLS
jgi:hypothetical protein